MDQYYQGKVAVVTGAAGVICSEVSRDLASLGCTVALVDLSLENAEKVAETLGGSVKIYTDYTEMADEVVVMYAGKVIEKGTVRDIFHNPLHPYTIGLQKSKPMLTSDGNEPLYSIPGNVPNPINLPDTCYFKNRCNKCTEKCGGSYPCEIKVSETHSVSCWLYGGEEEK